MRIVIDMQGAQADNRNRGLGRYTLAFAKAVARNRGDHEVILALSGLFPDSIEGIRNTFDNLLPQSNIRIWNAPSSVGYIDERNTRRRECVERVRESFLASLKPDIIHIGSLFEGFADDAVTSVGLLTERIPVVVTVHDLIPLIYPKIYLSDSKVNSWYSEKLNHLRRATLWLAISESSRRECLEYLKLPEDRVINCSEDVDEVFNQQKYSAVEVDELHNKYGLSSSFVMYTGGLDHRKNIEGLIRAYATLPKYIRSEYQLAVVCSVQPESRHMLEQLAIQQGLGEGELIITGFVPEEDLVALYNLCSLFVFPSWHEGFGLPALEAMRCGAPVIGANTSSLPEVIGWNEALFDPHSDKSIGEAIERGLTDPDFRQALIDHGKVQIQKFSWDKSAKDAILAMEQLHASRQVIAVKPLVWRRHRLAYVSPLPPERSGIADYSAELLPELAQFYEIDVISDQDTIDDKRDMQNCQIRTVQWFTENFDKYDRVLYHFGNSAFHQHMFDLLKAMPGVAVLHDFFLSGVMAYMELHGHTPRCWAKELYKSHGYLALNDRFHSMRIDDVIWKYPCSLSVIQDSHGVIVHSPNSIRLANRWYGGDTSDWAIIPLVRSIKIYEDKCHARHVLGFSDQDFVVCAFGILGPMKLNDRLLQAWIKSHLVNDKTCYLIFVGDNHPGDYGAELLRSIQQGGLAYNVRITGWVDIEVYRRYLAAADVAVQFRTLSRGETSAAILDCMNYSVATIVNANGSMADLPDNSVLKLPDQFSDEQFIEALESLRNNLNLRIDLGKEAREVIIGQHTPEVCARKYFDTIEHFYQVTDSSSTGLYKSMAKVSGNSSDDDLMQLADAIAKNTPLRNKKMQLLVDISELVQRDAKSGIQRVVRSILKEWLNYASDGYRVEPVYATTTHGYRYARRFTLGFLECPNDFLVDEPIEFSEGDVFIGLDLQPQVVVSQGGFYKIMRMHGVTVKFVIYDLICVLHPQFFPPGADAEFIKWLDVVICNDGALCISKTVADDLAIWVRRKSDENNYPPVKIEWFYLGSDVENSIPSKGLPANSKNILEKISEHNGFLMVGTVEPRKGHAQVLDAFELLWDSGLDVSLVIAGKKGWLIDDLAKRLRVHPEMNKRLFWFDEISDEFLEKLYTVSGCLIAASYAEGFGLPLIEAAKYKLPIIARDITIFREIVGEYAEYFNTNDANELSIVVRNWLWLKKDGAHPKSECIGYSTWKQSAEQLMKLLLTTRKSEDQN